MSKYVNARLANQATAIKGKTVTFTLSPVALLKAIKNPVEVAGMKDAHLRDSAAIVAFLSWIDKKIATDKATDVTEISAADKLLQIRK